MDLIVYVTDRFWREVGEQRMHSEYPLISGGPLPILLTVTAYLYFVRYLGPKWMESRKPFDLLWTIRGYNIMMSIANVYMFYGASVRTRFGLDYFGCREVKNSLRDNELVYLGYLYFLTKIIELLDTVFFVLRKKYNQASNLHVFHHSFIVVCVWIYFKTAPGGSSVLFPYLNSGVHSIMYGYYFLATFKGAQKYLWWKRYLTLAQIVQFIVSMVHFSFQSFSSCQYPPSMAIIGFTFNLVFLALFCNFYRSAYTSKPEDSKQNRAELEKSLGRANQLAGQKAPAVTRSIGEQSFARSRLIKSEPNNCNARVREQWNSVVLSPRAGAETSRG